MITIIINKQQEKKQIALIVDGILTEYYEEDFNETRKEGNIKKFILSNRCKKFWSDICRRIK